ncbi:MAG: glycosyltransferase family 2 protein [Chitinophagales bacterium]
MIMISAVIITLNEELNIARCIESIKNIADEIILVDSYSDDKTVSIAQMYGAKVFYHEFKGFGNQKAYAIDQAGYDWVLSIDADEVLSPELHASILKEKTQPRYDAYNINILPNYCGKWIRHCGWYPQPKLRFFNKHKCTVNLNKVHECILMNDKKAKIGFLDGNILHYSYKSISDHIRKIDLYSELAARNAVENGEKILLIKILFSPPWKFIYNFILRVGFLDGYMGYVICKNIAYAAFIKYIKIRFYSQKHRKIIN